MLIYSTSQEVCFVFAVLLCHILCFFLHYCKYSHNVLLSRLVFNNLCGDVTDANIFVSEI